jgi:site-specific DNA-methyltransferase (adenine-specific)
MDQGVSEVIAGTRRWALVSEGLRMLSELPDESIDALVTDPPYSSGGMFRGDRTKDAVEKYVRTENAADYTTFDGDSRDQRSFLLWATLWLGEGYRAAKPGAVVAIYADWRQLPTMTDAIQAGGWIWRGIVPWVKPAGTYRPSPGFPARCEYVLWGTKRQYSGPASMVGTLDDAAPRLGREEGKVHPTQKPIASVKLLLGAVTGGIVVDPFAGSGTTGIAALQTGRRCILAEQSAHYRPVLEERLRHAVGDASGDTGSLFGAIQ